MTLLHQGKLAFVYSRHATQEAADAALDDYFADGEVLASELAGIVKRNNRFLILLWAD